ncbi:MAG: hypothetical protein NT069_03455 [Planctomycetota bacterium]|nr:hypothetical protein [Planctomycetota bacterium]
MRPLISPNGKLTTIKSSNHLEAMDAVANLREIRKLVSDPESPRGPRRLVKQFHLEHAKAAEVQQQLQKLLGLDKGPSADPAAMMQQMANFMKQAGVAPGDLAKAKPTQPPPVHIVANARDNSVLVNAPADQMALVTEAIKVIDVPNDRSRSVLRNSNRVQSYPLRVAEPESVMKLLTELADLDPETRLQVDKKNRAIVAHANLADHLTIRTLIDKLDGTVRTFRVIPLSRLEADYVAGSLNLVMGGGEVTKRQSSKDAEDETRRFRVVADVEKNRLLLWVNDDELADVQRLLVELGEPEESAAETPTTVRALDSTDPAVTESVLRKIQSEWPDLAPNPLEFGPGAKVPPAAETPAEKPAPPRKPRRSARVEPADERSELPAAERRITKPIPMRLTGLPSRSEAPAISPSPLADAAKVDSSGVENPASDGASPIRIERDAQGRLVVASQDAQAVELLQKLFAQSKPQNSGFHVFRMKNKTTWAVTIAENLKQFFDERRKAEEKRATEQSVSRWFDPAGGKWIETPRGDAASAVKKLRNPPKFIVDEESNSILAVEADAEQIRTAEQLIDLYDTPEAQESPVVRTTRLVPIRFGNPKQIADTLKDVYKDLLTSATEPAPTGKKKRNTEPTYTLADGKGKSTTGTLLRFKGQLAIGVDESSSSVVISAPLALVDTVAETVTALDDAARLNKPKLQVFKLGRGVDVTEVQKRLNQAINKGK